ncbi:MAG: PHP domain-containing protein, partial [Actinomycetota bacterium]
MSARIDLHTHSNESDGTDTPLELLNKVAEAEIDRFALTDHDSIAGWQQIKDLVPSGIELVIGAEVSCQTVDALSVHMLGFLFDPENKALIDSMNETRGNRITRMERIVGRLQEAGIDISVEDVYAEVSEGATIGRPHLADAMIRKGIVRERGEAFERFLHNRSKFYIPDASPTPEEA